MGRFESLAMQVGSFGRGSGSMEECALSEGVREQGEQLGVLLIVSRSCAEERGPAVSTLHGGSTASTVCATRRPCRAALPQQRRW